MSDRRSGMVQSFGYPQNNSIVSRAVAAAAANNHHSSRNRGRGSKRYSVSVFYSMAAEQDVEVEDELAKGNLPRKIKTGTTIEPYFPPNLIFILIAQRRLRELKNKISTQSKKNFMRERDVRFLDARIGLLIQNRMALDEVSLLLSRTQCSKLTLSFIATRSCFTFRRSRG